MEPWFGSIISSEPDTDVLLMAHIALTSLWKDRLARYYSTAYRATTALPIALSGEPRMAAAS
jgi:hypothetical protein